MDRPRSLDDLRFRNLTRRQRLVLAYAAGVVAVVLVYTVVYNAGMAALEGRSQSIFHSFQIVIETMTTTGYGSDSPWATPEMNLLIVTMQVTGVGIGFVTLRVLVIPLFERAPLNLDDRLSVKDDHVVVAEYRRDTELLLDELETLGVDYVLLDSDVEEAKRLSDDGYPAINGDPEKRADLDRASIGRASILITDTGDRTASVVLTAREANEDLRVISFTGSTEVGRLLLAQGAKTVKKMSMELGGHAPFIVFPGADIDNAAEGAVQAKFQTTGQDCLAANRIFVHQDNYESFIKRFAELTRKLKVGHGLESGVEQGPLIDEKAVAKCEEHISDAREKGARVLAGGKRHSLGGLFFEPAVLADVTSEMKIFHEETFGPVAAVLPFTDEQKVIEAANDTEFGLAAYVYARDVGRIWRLVDALEYGIVAVNTYKMTGYPIPFGGMKQSGLGREGSRHGIDEYSELKYVCLGGIER
jgi:hypothetical protein